jgi:alpha-N-arabinofuranosidase
MKSFMSSCFTILIVLGYFMSILVPSNARAATIAHWDMEDGTEGAALSSMPDGGTVDSVNGSVMRGYSSTYGPSFSDETSTGSGLSAYCNGSQDGYTTSAAINAWSPDIWTIEMSVRLNDISGWETLIGRDGSSNGDSESDLYLQKNNVDGAFRINYETVTGQRWILDGDFAVEAGQWYHLAVTSDGATLTMYCDKLDGAGYQVIGSLDISSQTPAENALAASGDNWTFGRGWYNGRFTDYITGYFDNVRFSDAVLTPHEFLGYNPVIITQSDGKTVLFAGDTVYTDDYRVVLLQKPLDDVTVTVAPPAGLTVGNGDGQSGNLTFTDLNWDQPQTVTAAIADAQAAFNDIEIIHHTVQSDDPDYHGVNVPAVQVYIQKDSCGIWGYLEADYNFDCNVNLVEFSMLANLWLSTDTSPDLGLLAQDWLLDTFSYDTAIYNRSIQDSDTPFFVNTATILNTIDEKVYGHFLEHIYHSANGGLWGEMVWNRSFELSGSGGGIWTIEGTDLIQSSLSTDVQLPFGDAGWGDYELTLEARKDGGSEGFLVPFRYADGDNFYWLNLGGWNNTQHAVEKEINGSRSTISGTTVSGSIETGQWYTIRIRCQGNSLQIFLDDADIIEFTDSSSPHLAGQVGVGTWATQARYRNIQVTDLSGSTVLYSGLPAIPPTPFGVDLWEAFGGGTFTRDTDALNDVYGVKIVSGSANTGIQQDDYRVLPQAYHGSLWMKGTLPAGVSVELLDGSTVLGQATLPAPTASWDEYPFTITPTSATDDGILRIRLLGGGTVTIDQVSMMGQDAIDTGGYRPDLLEAVADLRPPIIRWPGGCFASLYLWKDAIGPQHQRRQYAAYMWDDQDTNSYGTDEFLRMCEQIGAEPLICVNTGVLNSACGAPAQWKLSPDTQENYIQDALDWMEYCNGDAVTTTWGAVRAANGHPEPYNVTFWEIDNETWAAGSAAYIARVQAFAPAMQAKAADLGVPIRIAAVGGGSYDMGWNAAVIDSCATLIDYISVHHYEGSGGFKTGPVTYDNFLTTLADYIAGSDNPDMEIYNSEWNLQTTDWRTGLYTGGILNVYERHGDDFTLGGPALFLRHTSAGGWDNAFINFDHTGWFAAPNYVVMKLWRDHYAPTRVETTGGDTNLSVSSVMSEDEKTLYLHLVNPDPTDKSVEFRIDDSFVAESAYMHYVAPGDLYARNTLANPHAVQVQAKVVGLANQTMRFRMPGYSAGVVTVQTTRPHKTKYLYSSFRNNGEDGLHLAYSDDGLTFTALNEDVSFLTPQVGSELMRDPSICQGPDGMFHMVWTTGWNDDGIGIAHSPDLINWSAQTYLPVMAGRPYVYNCWAPEIFYDEATGKFLIFWSTTLTEGATNDHRIYSISTEDFVTYTDAALFYDPGFSCIDGFIARDGDRFAMVLKDERNSGKNLRMTFSDTAEGPYGVPPSASISPSGLWVEGPSMVRVGAKWVLYYDAYTSGTMGGQSSDDLETWTTISSQLSFPGGTRHGTVFKVTEDVLEALKAL